jgi:uncharacterized protein DUF4178
LATEPTPQRSYRAACPHCGAAVDFRSAASAFAVCSYCRSSIVREGESLRRIGESAELFDDHSPLQLGTSGRHQGEAFTLVGRLQYRYKDGTWNEWHALFDNGRSGWLSEDNGRYVVAFDAPPPADVPRPEILQVGESRRLGGLAWLVSSVQVARLISAQGELPHPPQTKRGFVVADLRNANDEVGTLDYSDASAPHWSVGQSVALSGLALSGLSERAEKTLQARGVSCPSCGAAIEIRLENTKSVVCGQCRAVVDLSQGVGADLQHYAQDNGSEPQIPLGSLGRFGFGGEMRPWQVVGYVERCEMGEDEQTFWREYLLYHRESGFTFLVDTDEGWSWAAPVTGAPAVRGDTATHRGIRYHKRWDYRSKVTYVLGEFYWQLRRDQLTDHTDYGGSGASHTRQLNRERTEDEVVWSAGETLKSNVVLKAFNLPDSKADLLARDAGPVSSADGSSFGAFAKAIFFVAAVIVFIMLDRCDSADDCDSLRRSYGESSQEYRNCQSNHRSSGGSYGGFNSGGGGHK